MRQVIFFALNALMVIAVVASAALWSRLLRDRWAQADWRRQGSSSGKLAEFVDSFLPARPRRRPAWNHVDALAMPLVMLGLMMLISQLLMLSMISQGWIEAPTSGEEPNTLTATSLIASIAATSIGGIAGAAIVFALLRRFDPDARRKLGLTFSVSDLLLGLKASLLILPPVLLINVAVVLFIPYEHDVLESLDQLSTPAVFAATFLGTAIVTPMIEEFLVRGLLQGAFQGLADRAGPNQGKTDRATDDLDWKPRAYWPIVIASLIFASLHLGQGGAPIPLFFLSLGLGYLYRQTGSLLPPIIVHMVLNGLTLVVEIVKPPMGG